MKMNSSNLPGVFSGIIAPNYPLCASIKPNGILSLIGAH